MSKKKLPETDKHLKTSFSDLVPPENGDKITREQWKASILAGMASYLDAGSIVALGAGLALFQNYLNLSNLAIGILAAVGPNAIGCAIGSVIGGRLGDKLGRKRIYQIDLLVYAAGILTIALSVNAAMLFIGTFVVGVAVGADIPTSLAFVGEAAPDKARGKLLGFTQVAWSAGPVVVLLMAMVLAPLDVLGIRIVFLHLLVISLITWYLRQSLAESVRWKEATQNTIKTTTHRIRSLFSGWNLKGLAYTSTIYIFWGLAAGTVGIFQPYIINTLGAGSQAVSVGLTSSNFIITMIITATIFMPLSDRSFKTRKTLWGIGAVLQVAAWVLFIFLPFTIPVIILNIILYATGASLAGESFYKVFSQELFPTILRGTAQGLTFGIARMILGIWSFFVPVVASLGIEHLAALLAIFITISGVVGFFFMPDTSGKSLEQIERERS